MIIIEEYLIIEKVIIMNVQQSFLNLEGWGKGIISLCLNFEGSSEKKVEVGIYDFSKTVLQVIMTNCQWYK